MSDPGTATVRQARAVYDPLRSVDELTDPSAVEFVATQLNDADQNQNRANGAPHIVDLTEMIQDIIEVSVAQGSWTLEIHLIDPYWNLETRHGDQPAFFDVDDTGLLIPVDVNFPQNTDRWWRLAQATPVLDPTQPHIYVFEDRIVSLLRDQGGAAHAGKNQTRAQFIYSRVRTVPSIRFVCPALDQKAGSVGGDITEGQVEKIENGVNTTGIHSPFGSAVAKSAKQLNAPPARRNPAKRPAKRPGQVGYKSHGATWTKGGWKYTKPINGIPAKTLQALNPPTNVRDDQRIPQK